MSNGNRLSAGKYWLHSFGAGCLILFGLWLLDIALQESQSPNAWGPIIMLFGMGWNIDNTTKRFHDLNHSGWMMLTLCVPLVNIIVLFMLFLMPGTNGPNNYGKPS